MDPPARAGTPAHTRDDNSETAEDTPALDLSVLESRRGPQRDGEPDKLARIVGLFIDDVPLRLDELRQAVERGEAQKVEETAHMLKGGSGYMGAVQMAEICAGIQELGASGELSHAPELLDELEAEFKRIRPALEAAVTAVELVDDVSTGAKSLSTLAVALTLFGLAGAAVMVAVPGLLAGPERPGFAVFLVAGLTVIVLTAASSATSTGLAWASAGRSWSWPPAITP